MKKKRKINKYQTGGYNFGTDYAKMMYQNNTANPLQPVSPAMAPLVPQSIGGGSPILTQSYNPSTGVMGKIGGGASGILSGAGEMVDLVGGQSGATTGGEAAKQSVQSVFKGASTGAKMGAALGPVGAVVGGVAGAVVGSIGKSGKVQVNGFYEDPTLTLGTGFKGAVQNKKLREKYQDEKNRVIGNRFALQNSAQLQQDWAEDYDADVQTMAVGGLLGSSMAYVDDGEIINTPDGMIMEVPEEGKPTDSNLVNLPEGSRILSDKLKVPGTKETFAQMGKRMMSKKKSKNKDIYAENSAKLNQMNDQMIHDQLFSLLESMKSNKKPTKKYSRGGKVAMDYITNIGKTLGEVAPVLSNLNAKPETFDTVYNPYASTIMNTMASRKYDTAPARRAIRENRAISNYNASQSNTNTGANMAYRLQSQVAADKAIADLYAQSSNINNQYKGEYANTMNNLGQLYVQARNMSTDLNARSRGAARNINRAGWGQLSNYIQNRDLMQNQRDRDMAMLDAYAPFLESIYKSGDYTDLMNQFRKNR